MRRFYLIPRPLRWILSIMFFIILLMNLYRLFFFFEYRNPSAPVSFSTLWMGLRYDARIGGVIGLSFFLLSLLGFLNPILNRSLHKIWSGFFAVIFLVFMIFYVADFYHYDYLKQRLNFSVLDFLIDANISMGMVWQTYPVIKIIAGILLMLLFLFSGHLYLLRRISNKEPVIVNKNKKLVYYTVFFLLSALLVFGKLGQYPLRWSDAYGLSDDFKAKVALNPFQSFFSSFKYRNDSYDINKVREHYSIMADYYDLQQRDSVNLNFTREYRYDKDSQAPNIVLVICESFSAYKSSMFGNKFNTTPFFNSLCNEGVFFERCFTPGYGTARGVWATITGIPDVSIAKTSSRNPLAVDQHLIMNQFKSHDKFYFIGGSTSWANIRGFLNNNIEQIQIHEQENYQSEKVDVWGISDKNLFLESTKVLSKQKNPFFAIIQTADNHRPYTIPQEDRDEFKLVSYPEDTLKKYGFESNGQLNAFRYTDFTFRYFIEAAKKEKFFNNTIFVFVGDHGLRGDAGPLFPKSFSKVGFSAEHVPLLFYAPSILKPARIKSVCSQLDIMPSLAALARQSHSYSGLGRNLFDSTRNKKNYAFIADIDFLKILLLSDEYYFSKSIKMNDADFGSVTDDKSVPVNKYTDSTRKYMQRLAEGFFETSRYLLLNNKKSSIKK